MDKVAKDKITSLLIEILEVWIVTTKFKRKTKVKLLSLMRDMSKEM